MYGVFLVADYSGSYFLRYESKDIFDCEVYAEQRKYEVPSGCHFEICKLQKDYKKYYER